jgi:hypothetical protein
LRASCTKNGAIHERWLLSQNIISSTTSKNTCTSLPHFPSAPYMHQSAHSTAFYSFLPRFDTCTVASHRHASSGLWLSSLHYNVLISIRTLYSLHLHIALVGRRCRLAHSRGSENHIPYTSPAHANSQSRQIIYPFYLLSYAAQFLSFQFTATRIRRVH